MKCVDSRRQEDGTRLRKYRTATGRIVETIEVPTTVWRGSLNAERFKLRMAGFLRGEARRERQAAALAMLVEGVKPLAVGDVVGLSAREAQRLRRKYA